MIKSYIAAPFSWKLFSQPVERREERVIREAFLMPRKKTNNSMKVDTPSTSPSANDRPNLRSQSVTSSYKPKILEEHIGNMILFVRGHKVLLDSDLATLYGVKTKVLNQAIKRNTDRFPKDFMFQLLEEEFADLRSQSKPTGRWGGRRYPPYVFTEQGVAMLSGVLNSHRAVQVNIAIMRTFVKLRQMLIDNSKIARKIEAMERKYDSQFKVVFDAIRELMAPPENPRRRIGFGSSP
jgi:hypothetical protein